MSMRPTEYPYIFWIVDKGLPCASGTRLRVHDLVPLHLAGRSLRELEEAYPSYAPSELLSALAYSYDHKDEMDALTRAVGRSKTGISPGSPPSPWRRPYRVILFDEIE